MALSRVTQRLIRRCGVTPLMYQYGETVTNNRERGRLMAFGSCLPQREKNRPTDGS